MRRNGTCTGSLWKSHTRIVASILEDDASNGAPRRTSPDSTLDGILAEANERQRTHEFCVLVGNTLWSYSDVWAYAKGDPPTVSLSFPPISRIATLFLLILIIIVATAV